MAGKFRNNPIAVRQAILYDFLKGKPVYETYKEFCMAFGDDFMSYPEFELWWMRFSRGKFNLNRNRTLNPKHRTFTELPEHVFDEIAGFLSKKERYIMRGVSKNIQKIIDSYKPDIVNMRFKRRMLNAKRQKFACLLKNPKLELDFLEVTTLDNESGEVVVSVLKEMTHQVRVKRFVLKPHIPKIAAIIPKLDPMTLKKVKIFVSDESIAKMRKFLKLEQIKGLNSLVINTDLEPLKFPLKCFYNYPVFNIKFQCDNKFKPLAPFVKNLVKKDRNFRRCRLDFNFYLYGDTFFRNAFSSLGTPVPDQKDARQIPIQGTNDVYKLTFSDFNIIVLRKRKEEINDYDFASASESEPGSNSDSDSDSEADSYSDFDPDPYDGPYSDSDSDDYPDPHPYADLLPYPFPYYYF